MRMTVSLQVFALGRLRAFYNHVPLQFPTKKAEELLCFLLLHAGEHMERGQIAERLWPTRPPGKARRSLATELWRLRQALPERDEEPLLLSDRHTIRFNQALPHWFDVRDFERQAHLGLAGPLPASETCLTALEVARDMYEGDFFEGCYTDWCLAERERLQLLFLRVLKQLLRQARLDEDLNRAIAYGQQLLALDPLQEEIHRELMRCYAAQGQRTLALAQFQHCREILGQEIQTEPMPETWGLYRRIQRGQRPSPKPSSAKDLDSLHSTLAEFRHALDSLESAWQNLTDIVAEFSEGSDAPSKQKAAPPSPPG
jgi:DNA-binding SARP family transcriptional activator